MGSVTVIGPDMGQVDYRLQASAGCGLEAGADHRHTTLGADQIGYRLPDSQPLRWIGEGLREFGIEPGTPLETDADKAMARALMSGVDPRTIDLSTGDPRTGKTLVKPKMVVDPRGKLPTAVLLQAVVEAADAAGTNPAGLVAKSKTAATILARAERSVAKDGEVHRLRLRDAKALAAAADIDLQDVFGAETMAEAELYHGQHIRVGNRGYDMVIAVPKSVSEAWALARPDLAGELHQLFLDCVTEGFDALEKEWAGYVMAGHHGDGKTATRVESTGLLGWIMPHEVARPVGANVPDPHLHAHVVIAAMAKGVDGKWRVPGAGGQEFHRHAHALNALVFARFRAETTRRWGVVWTRDERTGAWEIEAIPAELRTGMSKRHTQILDELARVGLDVATASPAQIANAADLTREAKRTGSGPGGDLRSAWRAQADATVVGGRRLDVEAMLAAAFPGWDGPGQLFAGPGGGPAPMLPGVEELADEVFHPERGITAHTKAFRRSHALAAVLDALPGVDALATAETLTDELLSVDHAALLPELGATHMSNHDRYTTRDIERAELTIVGSADRRFDTNTAAIGADAAAMAVDVFEAGRGFALSAEQRAVVDRLLTAGHGVDAVIGVAGAGKTTLLSAARTGWAAAGLVVAGASTAAVACASLAAESGITSRTMASWIRRLRDDGLAGIDVLVLDEAAMMDDRQVARVIEAAEASGTKIVMVGDPLQLRSPGVGGSFREIHRIVGGAFLTENRRQRDEAERSALAAWRTGDRLGSLTAFAQAGRVHAVDDSAAALAQMLVRWDQLRDGQPADPHDRIARLLLMAGTNRDVDQLNEGARAIRIAAGEISAEDGHRFRLVDGGTLDVSPGDLVMLRKNDWRFDKTGGEQADVLNGFRGVVLDVDATGATVQWRTTTGLTEERVSASYIAKGGMSLGYALTVAKSQGLTSDLALVYGAGLDKNTAYPALSRARERTDLFLPRNVLEDDATRARLGEPASDAEALRRAVNAYVASLNSADDIMVAPELGHVLPAPRIPAEAEQETALAPVRIEVTWPMPWERRFGAMADVDLADTLAAAADTARTEQAKVDAERARIAAFRAGRGPSVRKLNDRVPVVAAQAAAIAAAELAAERHEQAETALAELQRQSDQAQDIVDGATRRRDRHIRAETQRVVDGLVEPIQEAKAHAEDTARALGRARAAAPPRGEWYQIQAEHCSHVEDFDRVMATARSEDAGQAAVMVEMLAPVQAAARAAGELAEALRAESELRDSLPVGARAIEGTLYRLNVPPAELRIAAREALAAESAGLPEDYAPWTERPYGNRTRTDLHKLREYVAQRGADPAAGDLIRAQAASGLRAIADELALRDRLPAGIAALEDAARTEADRQRAAAERQPKQTEPAKPRNPRESRASAARSRSTGRSGRDTTPGPGLQHPPHQYRPPGPDRGPSLGR